MISSHQKTPGGDFPARDAADVFTERVAHFAAEVDRHEARERRLGLVRISLFVGAGILVSSGISSRDSAQLAAGLSIAAVFLLSWAYRALPARDAALSRRDLHLRHVARVSHKWQQLPSRGDGLLPPTHAYAFDLDLLGQGSLFQRIDVTQTRTGEQTLAGWLGAAADIETIAERHQAVAELAPWLEFRQELEAAALRGQGDGKLDGSSFAEFARLPSFFAPRKALLPLLFLLPAMTLTGLVLGSLGAIPRGLWVLPLGAQVGLLLWGGRAAGRAFDLAAARQGVVEAFEHMLRLVERTEFKSPALRSLKARLSVDDVPPSRLMARLKAWASAAELRRQFLFYIFVNPLTLWDLHVLWGLERWNREVGQRTADWFAALGELEALCSFATLAYGDPDATLPEVVAADQPLEAVALSHPLLPSSVRVSNDLGLHAPGDALIVTGSNMAGKSTLLRALGLNVALALAGGPVCARRMRVPIARLRASMRIDDSLQEGASYFHAELTKLRGVVEAAESDPPILFLLDELLRGTNARARHVGARAVLTHLIERRARGVVATHDVALSKLESERPGHVYNVHFTDVVVNGEMRFDYRLRPGVVRTSNALRLLALAGIEVPPDPNAAGEAPTPMATEEDEASTVEARDEERDESSTRRGGGL